VALPKPDLHRLVDAIRELVILGSDDIAEHTGGLNLDAQNAVRRLVTRAIERGVELQRAALLRDAEVPRERDTAPPPWDLDGKTPVVPLVNVDDGDD
jgi:hypothetical protein